MNQKGFTLIELLVALAVGAVIMMGIVLAIHQVVWGTSRSNSLVVALVDVNHATLSIKKDIQMAQDTDLIDGDPVPQSSVTLTWTDYTGFEEEENKSHYSTYTLSGTELHREYDGTLSIVGRHITSVGFIQNDRIVTANITATGLGFLERIETLKFSMQMRPEVAE